MTNSPDLLAILGAGAIILTATVTVPSAYHEAQMRRLRLLKSKGDQCASVNDWTGARRWYKAALAGKGGLKGTLEERRLRLSVVFNLVRADISEKRFDEAETNLNAGEAQYAMDADPWARGSSAYYRSFIAGGRNDHRTARQLRQTAASQYKECGLAAHQMGSLQSYEAFDKQQAAWEPFRDTLIRIESLVSDFRPTEALRIANAIILDPSIISFAQAYLDRKIARVQLALHNTDAARRHLTASLELPPPNETTFTRMRVYLSLARVATCDADRATAAHYITTAKLDEPAETDSRAAYLGIRAIIEERWGEWDAVAKSLAEMRTVLPKIADSAICEHIQLVCDLLEIGRLTQRLSTPADWDKAAILIERLIGAEAGKKYPVYLRAAQLKIRAWRGERDTLLPALDAIERTIQDFLAVREPGDEVMLANDYGTLVEIGLATGALDRAEGYITRFTALYPLPLDAPQIAVWEGKLHLARGNEDAARTAFRTAIATGIETDAVREARELMATLPPISDHPQASDDAP